MRCTTNCAKAAFSRTWTRTKDTSINSALLYRLSYSGIYYSVYMSYTEQQFFLEVRTPEMNCSISPYHFLRCLGLPFQAHPAWLGGFLCPWRRLENSSEFMGIEPMASRLTILRSNQLS